VKVGLDVRVTRQQSIGMKAYVAELRKRLPQVAPQYSYQFFEGGSNFDWDEQVRLPAAIRRAHVDVMHFPSLYVPVAMPRRSIVTIHDLIHLRFPQFFKAKVGPYYHTVVRWACARAARVITDDERTVQDLRRFLGVDPAKVRVVALGAADDFFAETPPHRGERPYLLYVGNHREHKDLPTLFSAWAALPDDLEMDLYLTGPDDFDAASRRRGQRRVVALGDVSTQELVALYAGAVAMVTPALCEGFGLPMLEAMAAGCPVVACADAVPHVLEPAALTFEARNVAELTAILRDVAVDEGLRARFVKLGRTLARELPWDRCARATANVSAEVLREAC
jgi:glycosyltransferase involved in cell wall biosynthesis